MTRAEINNHPKVKPVLAKWRKARDLRDRVLSDNRYGCEQRAAVEKNAAELERLYDAVCALAMEGE